MIVELFTSGIEGIPISYSPRTDDAIALTLLANLCVGRYYFLQLFS